MHKRFAKLLSAGLGSGALMVAGCASTATTNAGPAPTPVAAAPATPGTMLSRAGQADAPTLAALQSAFGTPDLERREGAGAILTYRLDSCALVLVFVADPRNEFRLSEASAQPARPELQAPSLADCAAAAEARARTS